METIFIITVIAFIISWGLTFNSFRKDGQFSSKKTIIFAYVGIFFGIAVLIEMFVVPFIMVIK